MKATEQTVALARGHRLSLRFQFTKAILRDESQTSTEYVATKSQNTGSSMKWDVPYQRASLVHSDNSDRWRRCNV